MNQKKLNDDFLYDETKLKKLKYFNQYTPRLFENLKSKILRVSCGMNFTSLIELYIFGSNDHGQLGMDLWDKEINV